MNEIEKYGRCIQQPVKLNSIPASIIFMNNLVTKLGNHIIYHRIGSKHGINGEIVDHYEIMTSENQYDDIFICAYHDQSEWIPPYGYLFDNLSEMMCQQLKDHANVKYLDPEDMIEFDESYIFSDPLPDMNYSEELIKSTAAMPWLEKVIFDSFGTNESKNNFPYEIIGEYLYQLGHTAEDIKKRMASIKPREKIDFL